MEKWKKQLKDIQNVVKDGIINIKDTITSQLDIGLGTIAFKKGDYNKAREYYLNLLEASEKKGDIRQKTLALSELGGIYLRVGNYNEAIKHYQQAFQIYERSDNIHYLAPILNNIGFCYQNLENNGEAIKYYRQALQLFEKIGDIKNKAKTKFHFGEVSDSQGEYDEAFKYYYQALTISKETKDDFLQSRILNKMGCIERQKNNLSKALHYHQEALEFAKKLKNNHFIAKFLSEIGKDYLALEQYDQAYNFIEESIAKYHIVLEKVPIEQKRLFESEFENLFEELNKILEKPKNIEGQLRSDYKELLAKLSRIIMNQEAQIGFLISTMGYLKLPIPILIEYTEGGGILSSIKSYFKGKNQDIHFVCAHCGRIFISKLKYPGKFFTHLSKIAGVATIAGYFIPFISGISSILNQAAKDKRTINDIFSDFENLNPIPKRINLKNQLNKVTKNKPVTISEKENFWDQLVDFDMKLCDKGCCNYICREHHEEDCPTFSE